MHGVDAVCQQVDDLLGGVGDAGLFHGFGVVAEAFHDRTEARRNESARKVRDALDLVRVCDRHDTGYDRYGDAGVADLVEERIQNVVVKKHLRCKKGTAGFFFELQVFNVLSQRLAFGVSLRVTGAANAEIAVLADAFDQL